MLAPTIQQPAYPRTQYVHILRPLACSHLLIKKQVHLLVTNRDNPGFLRLYTATITATFLRKLDQPSVFSDSSLIIQHARIPPLPIYHIKNEIAAIAGPRRRKKRRS